MTKATQGLGQISGDTAVAAAIPRPAKTDPVWLEAGPFSREYELSNTWLVFFFRPITGRHHSKKTQSQTIIPSVRALELPYFLKIYFWSQDTNQAVITQGQPNVTGGEEERMELWAGFCVLRDLKEGSLQKKATDLAAPNSCSGTAWFLHQTEASENKLGITLSAHSAIC